MGHSGIYVLPGEPEIAQFHNAIPGKEHVFWLNIPVNYAFFVHEVTGFDQLPDNLFGLDLGHSTGGEGIWDPGFVGEGVDFHGLEGGGWGVSELFLAVGKFIENSPIQRLKDQIDDRVLSDNFNQIYYMIVFQQIQIINLPLDYMFYL